MKIDYFSLVSIGWRQDRKMIKEMMRCHFFNKLLGHYDLSLYAKFQNHSCCKSSFREGVLKNPQNLRLLPHHNLRYFKYPNHIVCHAQRYVKRKVSIVCTSFNEVLITGTSVIALIWLNFTTISLREVLCIKAEICYVSLVCGT